MAKGHYPLLVQMPYLEDLRGDYVWTVQQVLQWGREVGPRGLPTRELVGVQFGVNPYGCTLPLRVNRGVNPRLAALEALMMIGSVYAHDYVERVAPGYARVLVDPEHAAYGAYGPRVRDQLVHVVNQLHRDPATRQAVVTIWSPEDLVHAGDRPCTLSLQFLVRDDRLDLVVTMRSQDAWLGLAMDVFVFTQLQHTVALALGVPAGRYVHQVGSFHVYERDVELAKQLRVEPFEPPATWPHGVLWAPDQGLPPGWAPVLLWDGLVAQARRLMRGDETEPERALNAWYAEQSEGWL